MVGVASLCRDSVLVVAQNLCREACMVPILEVSQSLLSVDSVSKSFTVSPRTESLSIRPVVFSDFADILNTLQGRSELEKGFIVCFHQGKNGCIGRNLSIHERYE